MKKLLIISGPTAVGKTALALSLAKKLNGGLISVDSRQVYRGMDVVTGKELDKDIKTWLVDVVEPNEMFTVVDYYKLAWRVIKDIWQRGKLPIIVGGTGFYIKALLDGIGTMGVEPDWEFRSQLETLTVRQLQKRLQEVDADRWERMNVSDRGNPRRLVRAIEIAISGQSLKLSSEFIIHNSEFDYLWGGLTAPFTTLYERIDQRVDERVRQGAVEETRRLAEKYGWEIPSMTGQGYRELRGFIEGEISLEEAVRRWKFAEYEYARKQMTWFKKEKRIVWFDITKKILTQDVQEKVEAWYTKNV